MSRLKGYYKFIRVWSSLYKHLRGFIAAIGYNFYGPLKRKYLFTSFSLVSLAFVY